MREALPVGRQPVLLFATHLPESKVKSVRQQHRIVSEAFLAARRPDQRAIDDSLEFFDMAIRPRDRQYRDEMRLAAVRREGIALAQAGLHLFHGVAEISVLAGPA